MCVFPMIARLCSISNRIVFCRDGDLQLPCGKCHECIAKRALEWATRCKHELSMHEENCFLTLTYDDEHKVSDVIIFRDFQLFMKRLRKKIKRPVRYIVSSEYGTNFQRPHFHCILFGYSPRDQVYHSTTSKGSRIYRSAELEALWTYGYSSIGQANEATAFYIASYALSSSKHEVQLADGEIIDVQDTMKASKNPAIGLEFFKKYYLYEIERCRQDKTVLPRYYEKKLSEFDIDNFEVYQNYKLELLGNRSQYSKYASVVNYRSKNKMDSPEFRQLKDFTVEQTYLNVEAQSELLFNKENKL